MQVGHDQAASHPQPRSAFARRVLAVLAVLLIVLFAGLGTWQVLRLQWKLDLIARVNARVHAAPVAAPPAAQWAQVTKDSHEYRRVQLSGHYLYEFTTPVQALSSLGAGFWLLTPMCTAEGQLVFINRGFIPAAENRAGRYPARRAGPNPCAAPGQTVNVTGLLRINEPGGGFLRDNDPAGNRWYSRDVAAIGAARRLANVAPYFVDAAKDQDPKGAPERAVGGLTVISFQNNHLVYALTWYALALMVAGALWWAGRYGSTTTDD
ncbi:SURF1 family protein [Massilia sp. ZL223]|uniref:SURF1 family protein n=1 Tax=Massilia sp. ZL223 TaxID=2824904 RepID=UPI001B833F17|nr:SURF1 family protein [Massilia sp. ZL223]MBQ5965123.1 SURF1 family protein [Massilia sp. ZL223]